METNTETNNYKVFYTELEINQETNMVKSRLKNKAIPSHLERKFLDMFARKVKDFTITGEEIDEFLEKNS